MTWDAGKAPGPAQIEQPHRANRWGCTRFRTQPYGRAPSEEGTRGTPAGFIRASARRSEFPNCCRSATPVRATPLSDSHQTGTAGHQRNPSSPSNELGRLGRFVGVPRVSASRRISGDVFAALEILSTLRKVTPVSRIKLAHKAQPANGAQELFHRHRVLARSDAPMVIPTNEPLTLSDDDATRRPAERGC